MTTTDQRPTPPIVASARDAKRRRHAWVDSTSASDAPAGLIAVIVLVRSRGEPERAVYRQGTTAAIGQPAADPVRAPGPRDVGVLPARRRERHLTVSGSVCLAPGDC